ncbi:TraI/MobA(P) family conjugative relaxase [Pantoea agglomerans]|uniref:TraI/MobA(P) family conjugative relaxase n=1 Tax=Enterobacter agglomerans TaxID=549 RepID=UPI003C7B3874
MISKHIPMRNVKKSSFTELAKYIENPQNKQERVGAVRVTNCQQLSIVDAAKYEIEPTQRLNQRSGADKTYHFIISFRAGENPPQDVLDAIEDRMCAALGFAEHQRVSAVHHDTDNTHIHVAVNKIHPVTHNVHTPYNDFKTRSSMCQLLEKEYGLERDNHKAEKTLSENRAADMERHSGIESFLGWIKRECAGQIKQASTWVDLHQTLRENGLELRQKGNGFVITGPDGLAVKASSVDRSFSRGTLEKKLGAYSDSLTQPPGNRVIPDMANRFRENVPKVIRPGARPPQHVSGRGFNPSAIPVIKAGRVNRYEAKPLILRPASNTGAKPSREAIQKAFASVPKVRKPGSRPPEHVLKRGFASSAIPEPDNVQHKEGQKPRQASVSTTELYARYRQEQQALTATRNDALRLARAKRDRAVENAKRTGRLRRAAIKLLKGEGVNKRYLYGLASSALQEAMGKASETYKKDREAAYELHKRRTWADWLQHKAGQGNDDALQALRRKSAQDARKAADVLYGDKVRTDGRIPGLKPDSVTKEGTIIYRVGESAIRDGGQKLDVSRDAGEDGLHAALLMAKHRYGSALTVNGSIEFKKRIVAVAAARKLDVTFDDPTLERLRQTLSGVADRKRDYFQVPASKRAEARKAGAMWDHTKKSWYAGPYASKDQIEKFIRENEVKSHEQRQQREQRERNQGGGQRRDYGTAAERRTGNITRSESASPNSQRYGRVRGSNDASAGGGRSGANAGTQYQRTGGGGRNGLPGSTKPHFTKITGRPPSTGENRVRRVPEFNVVRHANRGEMLLQSEVRLHLDQQGAGSNDLLRRSIHRAGELNPVSATDISKGPAEKYIKEREQKRLKGFDIPKHRGYNSQDTGQYEYAGQRKMDGETLALIRRDKDIIVMPVNEYTARRLSNLKVGDAVTLTRNGSVRTAKGRKR